jgi:hypothetical protein
MPQGGQELNKIPEEWSGVFHWESSSEQEQEGNYMQNFMRFDRLDEQHLLISTENRIPKSNLAVLNNYINQPSENGQTLTYQIQGPFIFHQRKSQTGEVLESKVAQVLETPEWFIFPQTTKPFMLLDLSKKTLIKYSSEGNAQNGVMLFPDSDSLVAEETPMVLRQKGKYIYLNFQEGAPQKWNVTAISSPASGELHVVLNGLKSSKAFKERLDYYNSITPFTQEGDSYKANPTDAEYERLMQEDIFQTWKLKKIKS